MSLNRRSWSFDVPYHISYFSVSCFSNRRSECFPQPNNFNNNFLFCGFNHYTCKGKRVDQKSEILTRKQDYEVGNIAFNLETSPYGNTIFHVES